MKIIKEGKLPEPKYKKPEFVVLEGTCWKCGCVVEETYNKESLKEKQYFHSLSCPTIGCGLTITMIPKELREYFESLNYPSKGAIHEG